MEACPVELVEDRQREALLVECRARKIEPPGRWPLVAEDNEDGAGLLALLKRDPGAVGLDSLLTEITKLNDVRRLGLPEGLFAGCSEKLPAAWRSRAIKMYPSDFRDTAEDARITLLAEAKANEKVFKAKVRTTLRSSYSSYHRHSKGLCAGCRRRSRTARRAG
ncbi:hypothetical protein ACWC5C_35905 [Streptomyces sp. NPDC001700]